MAHFADVAPADWFFAPVESLAAAGIIQGFPDGSYRPYHTVTLAEMLKLLVSAMGFTEPTNTTPWYAGYVRRAREEGLLDPADPEPDYDLPVRRAEVARLLCRGLRLPLVDWDTQVFADVDQGDDKAWIDTAFDEYLMRGSLAPGGASRTFRPEEDMNRAEAAAVTDRFREYRQDPDAYRRGRAPSLIPGDRWLQPGIKVLAATADAVWAAGGVGGRGLYRSSNRGTTWALIHPFAKRIHGVLMLSSGTLLVSTAENEWEDRPDGELHRSSDGGATFVPVLVVRAGFVRFWNLAAGAGGQVFASEYGYKDLPNNARRIYRSTDDGRTWSVLYDPGEQSGYHNHKTLVHGGALFQSVGDRPYSSIRRSSDGGATWVTLAGGYDPTSGVPVSGQLVWGLDNKPFAGFVRMDPASGALLSTFRIPAPYSGPAYDLLAADGVLYSGLLSYDYNAWDGSLWTSRDEGRTWQLWARWPKVAGRGIGFFKFTRQGDDGYLWVTLPVLEGGEVYAYEGTVRFTLL